ncbi:hypothetical protein [Mycobacterium sp. IS-1742]|uniref:hypothetical protein n=1 Tax=Mycobacterium sp. IS-1742 TaxID=1772285 RepID=UPI0009EA117F|nr:hypothetical protein [Mycobacterium sp. IS-1742]
MKKYGLVATVAGALTAAVVGLAAPAQADEPGGGQGRDRDRHSVYDRDHRNYPWLNQLVPRVVVPHVDTTVRH